MQICRARLPADWDSFDSFERVVRFKLEGTSSPGYPLCREKPTIAEWLGGSSRFPSRQRMTLLWSMVQDVLKGNYEHIFKVFIKIEPHKLSKVREGRWRLIMMSSMPVQIVWHMAVGHLEDSFLRNMGRHPLRHGTMYIAGGWKRFREEAITNGRLWNTDKSGWDWNSPGWPYLCCKELRKRLTIGADVKWLSVLDMLYDDTFVNKKVILPDGFVYQQEIAGLMPSGTLTTISDNGLSQLFLDLAACSDLGEPPLYPIATGDDVAQRMPRDPDAYISSIQRYGCKIKESSVGIDFMGFDITEKGFFPKYLGKHLCNLIHQREEFVAETLDSYLGIYVFDEEMYAFFERVRDHLGVPDSRSHSREHYLYFANNPNALETYSVRPPTFINAVYRGAITD